MATGKVDSLDGSPEVHGITGVVEILGIDSSGQKSFYQINILAGGGPDWNVAVERDR